MYCPGAGEHSTSLSLSDEQMGLVFGTFWLAYALFRSPAAGWAIASDAVTITRIVLAWSLFTALTAAACYKAFTLRIIALRLRRRFQTHHANSCILQ